MPKWKKFKITYFQGEINFLERPVASVHHSSLPIEVRRLLSANGRYEVQRVARGGIPLTLKANSQPHTPAEYADGSAVLCARLCNFLGYPAKKPETIHVTIRKVEEPKNRSSKSQHGRAA
jgi:hypothetical protein